MRKLEGFNELRVEDYKSMMEAARLTSAIVVQMFSKDSIAVEDVFPFSWETTGEPYVMDVADFQERCRAWSI